MTDRAIVASADKRHDHARRCKKAPDECATCQENIRWFGSLRLDDLSVVLSEPDWTQTRKATR